MPAYCCDQFEADLTRTCPIIRTAMIVPTH